MAASTMNFGFSGSHQQINAIYVFFPMCCTFVYYHKFVGNKVYYYYYYRTYRNLGIS